MPQGLVAKDMVRGPAQGFSEGFRGEDQWVGREVSKITSAQGQQEQKERQERAKTLESGGVREGHINQRTSRDKGLRWDPRWSMMG